MKADDILIKDKISEMDEERRDLNKFLFKEIIGLRQDVQKVSSQVTLVEINQTSVVMPKIEAMTKSMENLDKKIRGNGVPGYDQRIDGLEKSCECHSKSLYDKDDGVVPYVRKTKLSVKLISVGAGAVGAVLGVIFAFLATPIGEMVCKIFVHTTVKGG